MKINPLNTIKTGILTTLLLTTPVAKGISKTVESDSRVFKKALNEFSQNFQNNSNDLFVTTNINDLDKITVKNDFKPKPKPRKNSKVKRERSRCHGNNCYPFK